MAKISITFKDPDSPHEAIQEAAKEQLAAIPGLTDEDRELLLENRVDAIKDKVAKWLEYGEYITIEFDLDAGTATVQES